MQLKNGHIAVMPPVYEIQLGMWRWCKLGEVCEIVWGLREITGTDFAPTPTDLVSRFAALAKRNRPPNEKSEKEKWLKKIFRYSHDGIGFWGTEVPTERPYPPYVPFTLDIGTPYPADLFVPEGWVIDTLKAVRLGAVAAADFGDHKIGFCPMKDHQPLRCITLEGEPFSGIIKFPDCVRL